ncbi:hypothetical protein BASA61_005026 [Batrachochytrium salamandrivorans]|nr:hypothetical protein BASA62_008670 [Batrachochytrium salamandrivorans]KAH6591172.1 hypothetical protein BASA61_005026 [Batrachochytrium salamandrivorans]KAH9274952.1 hypothetical protein BASA83_002664 [Batrachochytrium salamandrivorans]
MSGITTQVDASNGPVNEKCSSCEPDVEGEEGEITYRDTFYHSQCIRCHTCRAELNHNCTTIPMAKTNKLFCSKCTTLSDPCPNRTIESAALSDEKTTCVIVSTCHRCRTSIIDLQHFYVGNGIYCLKCYSATKRAAAVAATSSAVRGILSRQQRYKPKPESISHGTSHRSQSPLSIFPTVLLNDGSPTSEAPTPNQYTPPNDNSSTNRALSYSASATAKSPTITWLGPFNSKIQADSSSILEQAPDEFAEIPQEYQRDINTTSHKDQPVCSRNQPTIHALTIELPYQSSTRESISIDYPIHAIAEATTMSKKNTISPFHQLDESPLCENRDSKGMPSFRSFDDSSSHIRGFTTVKRQNRDGQNMSTDTYDAVSGTSMSTISFCPSAFAKASRYPGQQVGEVMSATTISESISGPNVEDVGHLKILLQNEKRLRKEAESKIDTLAKELMTHNKILIKEKIIEGLETQCSELSTRKTALYDQVEELQIQSNILSTEVHKCIQKCFTLIQSHNYDTSDVKPSANETHPAKLEVDLLIETFKQDISNLEEIRNKLFNEIGLLKEHRNEADKQVKLANDRLAILNESSVTITNNSSTYVSSPEKQSISGSPVRQDTEVFPPSPPITVPVRLRPSSSDTWGSPPCIRHTTISSPEGNPNLSTSLASNSHGSKEASLPRNVRRERSQTTSGKAGDAGRETIKWAKELKNNIAKAAGHSSKRTPDHHGGSGTLDDGMLSNVGYSLTGALTIHGQVNKARPTSDSRSNSKNGREYEQSVPYHRFLPHSYLSPKKCDQCFEKLWGKELRCEACGYHCHSKCSASITGACSPPSIPLHIKKTNTQCSETAAVFGVDLVDLVRKDETNVPKFVTKCVNFVESKGMSYEGIYRKSGSVTQTIRIVGTVNKGEEIDFDDESNHVDISSVTSALKQYFRELPDTLICCKLYNRFLETIRFGDARDNSIKILLTLLPKEHFETLSFMMWHLYRVQQQSATNLMTASNLGVVFGPTLLRPETHDPMQDLQDSSSKSEVVEYLITKTPCFFEL